MTEEYNCDMLVSEGRHNLGKLRFKRKLRQEMTSAEEILWKELRAKRLAGTKWRRQSNIGTFIADFRCAEHRLIVEVDGEIHEFQKEYDKVRTEIIGDHTYRVIRFTNKEVLNELPMVLKKISEALSPHPPSPSPHCGEGVA